MKKINNIMKKIFRINNIQPAFSLMEMMVVLLIVAIIAAATAPMVTKKMTRNAGSNDSPWVFTGLINNNIAFLDENSTVSIGTAAAPDNNNNGVRPRLYIAGSDSNRPHIGFGKPNNDGYSTLTITDDANGVRGFVAMSNATITPGSVAIGMGQTLTGATDATLVGHGAQVTGNNGTALGSEARAEGNRAIAMGNGAYASGADSVAIGTHNGVAAEGATQQGASAMNTVAIGNSAIASNTSATALGSSATASAGSATAIGVNTNATASSATALGDNATALGNNAIAIGNVAIAKAANSIAIGRQTLASEDNTLSNAIAIGNTSRAIGNQSIAIGLLTTASATNSLAIGNSAVASTAGEATAVGTQAQATQQAALALGNQAIASNTSAIAIGTNVQATAENAIAIGRGFVNERPGVIQLGTANNTVYIPGNLVVGQNTFLGTDGDFATSIRANTDGDSNYVLRFAGARKLSGHDDYYMVYADRLKDDKISADKFGALGGIGFTVLSDRRLKNVGEKYVAGMDELKKLDFFHYTFKKDKKKTPHVGVMAQDLQKVFPDAVTEGNDGFLRIRMEDMFYAVINAVKELDNKIAEICTQVKTIADDICSMKKIIETQQEEIKELKKQNKDLEKQISEFDKRLKKLEKKEK